MPLSDLTEKILSDAREEERAIRDSAREEAEKIKKSAETEKKQLSKESTLETEKLAAQIVMRGAARGNQRQKLEREQVKRERLDAVFSKALDRLKKLSRSEYEAFLAPRVASLPKTSEGVFAVPADRSEETRNIISEAGFSANPTEVSHEFSGGCVYRTKDAEYDFSFESLIREEKSSNDVLVAGILFGN